MRRKLLSVCALTLAACTQNIAPDPPRPAVATPRVLPSGRPACGNVASRAPRPAECDEQTR